jgi:hypothetical protein
MMQCGCGKELSNQNKSGLCVQCFNRSRNADPEFQRRRLEGIHRKAAEPAHRAKMASVVIRNSRRWAATPEGRAWMEQNGKRLATEVLRRPDVMAKAISPEARAKANRAREETWYGFCPAEYRPLYKYLRKTKKLTRDEAISAVQQEVASDLAKLSPFERQMRALQKGAQLIANDQKPSLANPGIYRAGEAA